MPRSQEASQALSPAVWVASPHPEHVISKVAGEMSPYRDLSRGRGTVSAQCRKRLWVTLISDVPTRVGGEVDEREEEPSASAPQPWGLVEGCRLRWEQAR